MSGKEDYRLAAVMFTDICGFSRMMEADESGTLALLKDHNDLIMRLVAEYGGNVIKTIGDAFLLDFKNTNDAVKCALDIQEGLFRYNQENGTRLVLRIGIHLGDIWFFENDALGEVINIASRLQTLARPGRICISHDVYNQILNKIDVEIVSLGMAKLKNISKEIYAYEILTPLSTPEPENDVSLPEQERGGGGAEKPIPDRPPLRELDDAELGRLILDRLKAFNSRVPLAKLQDDFSISSTRLVGVLDSLSEKGLLTKVEKRNRLPEYVPTGIRRFISRRVRSTARQKIEKKIRKALRNVRGFRAHLSVFGVINTFLFAINMLTSAHNFWFLYPLGGWGIGMGTHYMTYLSSRRQLSQLKMLPDSITERQYRLVDRYQRMEMGAMAHAGAYFFTNAFLLMVNLITSASHFWFIYPLLGWGIGFSIHQLVSRNKRADLLVDLKETGFDTTLLTRQPVRQIGVATEQLQLSADDEETGYQTILEQSNRLTAGILQQLKSARKIKKAKVLEIETLLNDFTRNIQHLVRRDAEISNTMATTSASNFEDELADLRQKQDAAVSEELKAEYRYSIEQYERFHASLADLNDQKEIIYLRISSALMSLKQLQLDLQNIEEIEFNDDNQSLSRFREKLEDLTSYVRILREGYQDMR